MAVSKRRRGFRAIGWIAAYALALQGLLSAFAPIAPVAALDAGLHAVLCLGKGAPDGSNSKSPDAPFAHCAACFTLEPVVSPEAAPVSPTSRIVSAASALHPPERRTAASRHRPGLARAPPRLV